MSEPWDGEFEGDPSGDWNWPGPVTSDALLSLGSPWTYHRQQGDRAFIFTCRHGDVFMVGPEADGITHAEIEECCEALR